MPPKPPPPIPFLVHICVKQCSCGRDTGLGLRAWNWARTPTTRPAWPWTSHLFFLHLSFPIFKTVCKSMNTQEVFSVCGAEHPKILQQVAMTELTQCCESWGNLTSLHSRPLKCNIRAPEGHSAYHYASFGLTFKGPNSVSALAGGLRSHREKGVSGVTGS